MLTVIVAGRNDDYGGDFRQRIFRTALHNAGCLRAEGLPFEYLLAEWNPLADRPVLSEEFVARVPHARSVIIPPGIHRDYSLNRQMPFHEMAAKNAALRRAKGDLVIVTNADILFTPELVHRIAQGGFAGNTLYRAHRIDVNPELCLEEMQNPANQLASGEGFLPPPSYLGAGGDFCLAARDLWHGLRGFNERIRFSTRAKDWQFFLSAAAQGAGIEFIGDVYHLDHEGGFRNTSAAELKTDSVHFGAWWDIEFGLPVTNPVDWGFAGMRQQSYGNDPRIIVLESNGGDVPEEQDRTDREMVSWLTRPSKEPDTSTALLFHAICAAHRNERRLFCRLRSANVAVALSGFAAIGSRFGMDIYCNWLWPEISGYTIRPFQAEPAPGGADWILEEAGRGIHVHEYGSGRDVKVLPEATPVHEPEFNPILARRLLRAILQLQSEAPFQTIRIALYGAGSHTRDLLRWGLPDYMELVSVVDSRSLASVKQGNLNALLLSSSSFESDMMENCRLTGVRNVIALYGDWPADLWSANLLTLRDEKQPQF